jgi:hypothetical protein
VTKCTRKISVVEPHHFICGSDSDLVYAVEKNNNTVHNSPLTPSPKNNNDAVHCGFGPGSATPQQIIM